MRIDHEMLLGMNGRFAPKAAVRNFICHRRPRMTTAWSQRAQANFV
jgi:hypothetical protein